MERSFTQHFGPQERSNFFWIGLKRRTTQASHVTKMDGKMASEKQRCVSIDMNINIQAYVRFALSLFHLIIRLL